MRGTDVCSSDLIVGVDVSLERLTVAQTNFPERVFVQARGEALPFCDETFHMFICKVALPYMNIPLALSEANRVLMPGGSVYLSLHRFRFTLHELKIAFPKPKAFLFRLWVMVNGLILHCTGKPKSIRGRYESFQTVRGISLALRRAGFELLSVSYPPGPLPSLVVRAQKPHAATRRPDQAQGRKVA